MESNETIKQPEQKAPVKKKHRGRRILLNLLAVLLIGGGAFVYVRYYFVFGSGIKTGTLNYVVNKGYLFKTYEGEMILSGFSSGKGGIQSNEFLFSIDKKEIAEKLMRLGGMQVELSYKEYLAPLPWRGYSKFVVDSIVSVSNPPASNLPYVVQ